MGTVATGREVAVVKMAAVGKEASLAAAARKAAQETAEAIVAKEAAVAAASMAERPVVEMGDLQGVG